jgi:hypothetical protein
MPGDVYMRKPSDCSHNHDGYCKISSDLAKIPVPIAEDACAACIKQTNFRAKNSVTCSKAIYQLNLVRMPIPQELLDCLKPPTTGPGAELEKLIEKTRRVFSWFCLGWLIPDTFYCGCSSTKTRMNELGAWGCLREADDLAIEILARWIKHFPTVRYIPFVTNILAIYVVRAVVNTSAKENQNG